MDRIERCIQCNEPTGRAGACEDSMFCDQCGNGPLCEQCYGESERIAELEAALSEARESCLSLGRQANEQCERARQAERERDEARAELTIMTGEFQAARETASGYASRLQGEQTAAARLRALLAEHMAEDIALTKDPGEGGR